MAYKKRHVAVVGAGFAGLAAARKLQAAAPDVQVTVLEASRRVGGRAHTVEVPGSGPVSLGCTWFHGVLGHPLYELALQEGLLQQDVRLSRAAMKEGPSWKVEFLQPLAPAPLSGRLKECVVAGSVEYSEVVGAAGGEAGSSSGSDSCSSSSSGSSGDVASSDEEGGAVRGGSSGRRPAGASYAGAAASGAAAVEVPAMAAHAEQEGGAAAADHATAIGPAAAAAAAAAGSGPSHGGDEEDEFVASTLGDLLRWRMEQVLQEGTLQGGDLQAFCQGWALRERLQRAYDGPDSSDDMSLHWLAAYCHLPGPNMPVPGGYQLLAQLMATGLHIQHGREVEGVSWAGGEEEQQEGVVVTCSDGSALQCDAVVFTASLGVLQEWHAGMFQPPLPASKLAALEVLRLGAVEKLYLAFDHDGGSTEQQQQQPQLQQQQRLAGDGSQPGSPSGAAPSSSSSLNFSRSRAGSEAGAGAAPPAVEAGADGRDAQQQVEGADGEAGGSAAGEGQAGAVVSHAFLWPVDSGLMGLTGGGGGAAAAGAQQQQADYVYSFDLAEVVQRAGAAAAGTTAGAAGRVLLPGSSCSSRSSSGSGSAYGDSSKVQQAAATAAVADVLAAGSSPVAGTASGLAPAVAALSLSASPEGLSARGGSTTPDSSAELPSLQGASSSSAAAGLHPAALHSAAHLPTWLKGLHSIRFAPSPEWVTFPTAASQQLYEQLNSSSRAAGSGSDSCSTAVLWVTGQAARELSVLSDQQVLEHVAGLLELFPALPLPPGCPRAPTRLVRSTWVGDRHYRGSYSYIGRGGTTQDVEVLAQPLLGPGGQPLVCFAGEATDAQYMGTAHGAVISGEREAARLLQAWGLAA